MEELALLLRCGDFAEQEHIGFVRRIGVARQRPKRRQPRGAQNMRRCPVTEMAPIGSDMRRQRTLLARLRAHFQDQIIEGPWSWQRLSVS